MQHHASISHLHEGKSGKVMTAREAVQLIGDGDTVATGGFVGIGFAVKILPLLLRSYFWRIVRKNRLHQAALVI
jgi:propionate CoA-transferase